MDQGRHLKLIEITVYTTVLTQRTYIPQLPNVSSETISGAQYRFFSNREPLLNSFTSDILPISKEMKHQENDL